MVAGAEVAGRVRIFRTRLKVVISSPRLAITRPFSV